jgi:hypothetical protein
VRIAGGNTVGDIPANALRAVLMLTSHICIVTPVVQVFASCFIAHEEPSCKRRTASGSAPLGAGVDDEVDYEGRSWR